MPTLLWIVAASLLGGAVSIIAAAWVAFRARASTIPMLVSYSVGALLGAAFLGVLPHAMEGNPNPTTLGASVLAGLLVFFLLEKLVLWHHHHGPEWGEDKPDLHGHHGHDHGHHHGHGSEQDVHGGSGLLIIVGGTVHNFVDGVLIAAAFLADQKLGILTAVAIMAHEVPSEVGNFLVLLHSGYAKRKALLLNLMTSAAMVMGGLVGYGALHAVTTWIPALLGFVAASMIYVAVADLIPGLHRRVDLHATLQQVVLIALGIGTIAAVQTLIGH